MSNNRSTFLSALGCSLALIAPAQSFAASDAYNLPAGTRVYLSLDEHVTSARGGVDVGTLVRCRVWRDVENRGVVFIRNGTPATCRVDKVGRVNIGGIAGSLEIGGVDTKSTDGQSISLSGGYHKGGSDKKVMVWAVGLLLFWPALFVPGNNADLPPGTVFDASTVNDLNMQPAVQAAAAPRVVNLGALVGGLSADFMTDDFIDQPKHDFFHIRMSRDSAMPQKIYVDTVNGQPIDHVPVAVKDAKSTSDTFSAIGEISSRSLIKYFAKGINRFTITYDEGGERHSTEVIMNVQM